MLEVPRGGDVRYVSRRSSERSVVHISSQMESWASDQESSSTDYEEIDLNDTNDIEKSDNVVEAHDAEEFDDVSSSGQSGTSAKDDDFQIIERNEVSVEDDFDVNEDGDKNSNFEDIAVVLENNNLGEDDDDIVKTIDVNDNTDECESLEVTEAVESESSESEVGLDADDEDDDSLDNGIDTCMVDNITITIRNDARIRDSNDDDDDDDRGQETLKQTQKELPIDKGLQEENEEEKEVLDVRSVGSADPEQPDGMDEEVQVGGNSKGNGSTDDKVESKNVIEVENERKDVKKMRSRKSVKEEDGSSSDSSSSSSSDSDSSSSDDTTSSSDSQSDDPDARIIKSKVACETKDKKASMGKNNVSTTLKDNTKLKTVENKGSRTSPKGEGQIDHDHISIGGGSSDNDNDFDEDNQPVVKSTVRMRRLYSNSKGKKRSRSSSTEGLSRQQRSRSRTRTDRSRSQGRLWERSNFQDWSHNRWRRSRSRSRERNSYRIRYRYSNREPRRTRSRSRDNLLSRSSRAFDHRKTRSRSRDQSRDRSKGWSKGWSRDRLRDGKDTKTSGGLERSKQRKDEKVSREPEKTREQKDSKLKTSVENKRVRERKQETNGRVENLSPKEHYKLTSCVRKKSVAVPEKRRDELDIHGKTAANRHKKGDDMTVRQAVKGLQKGWLFFLGPLIHLFRNLHPGHSKNKQRSKAK